MAALGQVKNRVVTRAGRLFIYENPSIVCTERVGKRRKCKGKKKFKRINVKNKKYEKNEKEDGEQ